MNEPIVRVENLSHRYATQWAIKDINFELNSSGIYGLLGANGAGKSTIMNIMCGVLKQTQGDVFIKGVNLIENPVAAKRHIGFLPQQAPLIPELTVEEFLTYSADLRLMETIDIKPAVDEVMAKVGINHFRKRLIKNLSGGFQQRVGIAQAIIHKPDFVILDEPTNGLDPNQILEVRHLIKEIAEERTVILSTHILQEVQALCDDIWMINEGSVVFSGGMDEFFNYLPPSSLLVSLLANPAEDELMLVDEINDVTLLGGSRYRIKYKNTPGIMEKLVLLSVEKGWRLSEITPENNSLDDVFSELSKKVNN